MPTYHKYIQNIKSCNNLYLYFGKTLMCNVISIVKDGSFTTFVLGKSNASGEHF